MSEELRRYRQLERLLWFARWRHPEDESPEEDALLDEVESVWTRLSESEQASLRSEGPRCWPDAPAPPDFAGAPYLAGPSPWPYQGFSSPAETLQSAEAA